MACKSPTTCARPGCKKPMSSSPEGTSRPPLCVAHARPSDPCAHEGCGRKASHGVKGTRKQEYCVEHAKEGMVNLRSKRCAHPGCFKIPTYGIEGSKIRDFCAPHAKPGMININSTKCIHVGCNVEASFGVGGDGRRLLCSKHFSNRGGSNPRNKTRGKKESTPAAKRGTSGEGDSRVYIVPRPHRGLTKIGSQPCSHRHCCHRRTHGVKGSATPQFCREHADKGMVDIVIQRCDSRGCSKLAKFGVPNSWTREYCAHHAEPGMVRDGVAVYPGEAGGGRKRKDRADSLRFSSSSAEDEAPERASKKSCTATVSTRAKAARERRATEPKTSPVGTRNQPSHAAATSHIMLKPRRHWPGTALLQTSTGWSRWKWPSSLTRVAVWPSE